MWYVNGRQVVHGPHAVCDAVMNRHKTYGIAKEISKYNEVYHPFADGMYIDGAIYPLFTKNTLKWISENVEHGKLFIVV